MVYALKCLPSLSRGSALVSCPFRVTDDPVLEGCSVRSVLPATGFSGGGLSSLVLVLSSGGGLSSLVLALSTGAGLSSLVLTLPSRTQFGSHAGGLPVHTTKPNSDAAPTPA